MAVTTSAEHQEFEKTWWGNCANTFSEEARQITYAQCMGLVNTPDQETGRWPQYNLHGKSILDIGGGPCSLLLKCINGNVRAVVDPCEYPEWTRRRYASAGITLFMERGESFQTKEKFDEEWIYNVLQHVESPEKIIETARKSAPVLRIFDWINFTTSLGHPHALTKEWLDNMIGCDGKTRYINENSAFGDAYYGVYSL